jgi:hypothetical protein
MGYSGSAKCKRNLTWSPQLHRKVFGQDIRATLFSIMRMSGLHRFELVILSPDMQAIPVLIRESHETLDAIDRLAHHV